MDFLFFDLVWGGRGEGRGMREQEEEGGKI